jgi:hypothetical protein
MLRVRSRSPRTYDERDAAIRPGMLLMNFAGRHDVDIPGVRLSAG